MFSGILHTFWFVAPWTYLAAYKGITGVSGTRGKANAVRDWGKGGGLKRR